MFASNGLPTDMACILKSTQMTILNDIEKKRGIGCGISFPFQTARFEAAMCFAFECGLHFDIYISLISTEYTFLE